MSNNTGGPAFPQERTLPCGSHEECEGMTLRDYFAARAMQSTFYPAILESIRIDQDLNCDKIAEFAYTMADAMIAVREASNGS